MQQLTSLSNAKAWLGETATANDAMITRLIEQASQFILNYLQRPTLFKDSVAETRDGLGGTSMVLRQWPVVSVESLVVGLSTISAAPAYPNSGVGYSLEPWDGLIPGRMQQLSLRGYTYERGFNNIIVNYTYGFYTSNQSYTVPAGSPYTVTVTPTYGVWGQDEGVTISGTALTKVANSPASMQYSVADGVYTFNAAQANATALISYSYVPKDIEQACIEIVGERYRYRQRIGQQSVSAAGQITTSFSLKAMQDYTREQLDLYKRIVPV